ncbi:MAG: hypothetical protein QOJ38_1486 [Solirubrobacterales bacterium]|jgi:uncharacterized membrane protein|nr:hypothetical protein [Solirubrobacterales bacterium]
MTRYEALKALHVITSIIWIGAGFLIAVLVRRAEAAGDRERQVAYQADVSWLSTRLFIPTSLAVFILGILTAIDGNWSFSQPWISIGFAGYLVSFGLGILFFKPQSERIGELVEQDGPNNAEAGRLMARVNIVERFQLLVLFIVVADMVVKPTSDDSGTLIVGGALVALAGLLALAALRRVSPDTSSAS